MQLDIFDKIEESKNEVLSGANEVRLAKLEIKNYRAIDECVVEINGRDVVFVGDSGVGKTTRIEALLWLLTNRLFDGSTKSLHEYIMPKNANKDTVLTVEATFDISGDKYVFTKQMREKWVKKRGSDDVVFEGVDTTYYCNGVEKKTVSDYNKSLYEVFGLTQAQKRIDDETENLKKIDLIMLLTVLDFFPSLDTKTLRELVLLVSEDVKIQELEMSELMRNVLTKRNYNIDEVKKLIKNKLKGDKNNKGLRDLVVEQQAQLGVYQKQLSQFESVKDFENAKIELDLTQGEIARLENELSKTVNQVLEDYDNKINALVIKKNQRIIELQNETNATLMQKIVANEKELRELNHEITKLNDEINENKHIISASKQAVLFKEGRIETIKERGNAELLEAKTIQQENAITCPKCEHEFVNEANTSRYEAIKENLSKYKSEIAQLKQDITELTQEEINAKNTLEKQQIQIGALVEKRNFIEDDISSSKRSILSDLSDFNDELVLSITKDINSLKNEKTTLEVDLAVSKQKIKSSLDELREKQNRLIETLGKKTSYETAQKEGEVLSKSIRENQTAINELEQLEIEIKILEETYLVALDKKIENSFGENIKFKMFETNLSNDNLNPICEMYVKDSFGRWVNAINGINTGHSVPRLVEFIVKVKQALGIRNGLLLIDFFESIGKEPLAQLQSMGQQIIATEVKRNIETLQIEML